LTTPPHAVTLELLLSRLEIAQYTSCGCLRSARLPLFHPQMAIFYFNAQAISRSSGKNACRAAAYNARTKIVDEKAQKSYDYSDRTDLAHSLIMTPQIDGRTVKIDRSELWNLVEAGEKRPDAQLARSIVLALPTEIDHQAKWLLTQKFVRDNFTSQGMIADVNIHDINSHNPHVHILLTMRDISEITPSGEIVFGLKNRTWNDKKLLEQQKESWANTVNKYLELAQVPDRIDHRPPTDRVPQIHIGTTAWEMEQRGIQTERGDLHRKIAEINCNIELLRKAAADTQQSLEIELRLEVERREAAQREEEQYKALRERIEPIRDGNPVNHIEQLKETLTTNPTKAIAQRVKRQPTAQKQPLDDLVSPAVEKVSPPPSMNREVHVPTRLEIVNWYHQTSSDRDREEIAALGQQLKDAYMAQASMQGQPVPVKLPNDYKSDKVAISLADKQRFNERKEQTPLGQFINSCKELVNYYETDKNLTAKPSFAIDQTIKSLEKIAEEDPINRDGIKQLNKTLKSFALENRVGTGKLSKLISELEKIRDNPEQYRDSLQDRLNREVNANYHQKNPQTEQQSRPKKSQGFER
jgi:MobA/MobL family